MKHNKNTKKLNRTSAHRKALLNNLVLALFEHEQIKTTVPKAKFLKPFAEKLISLGRIDTLHNRRKALSVLKNEMLVNKLFTVFADRYKTRPGGYTRILKAGFRYGDMAPVAYIQLVDSDKLAQA
ncbi:50S ribosomal protein L17 [Rickettsiales endosymbiont of Stachyamoeba lipophora]|uniref:50S ribosomal protein L17 n=1 Tax=Rickettsiales endosymbiont of Stachyamoeba lipophora TaxID=2486578 RepID=UPI000F65053B|nr:50S ribosomal protein L17 [Rickettsiales endosymbiont of Stachyamoeba lipophora]AZL15889.1 50S ribosomal protein L17 [Rickettsiales endosymbiont of Stachyamoeba lipophora]